MKVRLHIQKATADDGLKPILYKRTPEKFECFLADVFTALTHSDEYPQDWARSVCTMLHKGKSTWGFNDFRTVQVQCAFARLYCSVLEFDISKYLARRRYLGAFQFGGRQRRSTVDGVMLLRTVVEQQFAVKRIVFCVFIDFSKAFDSVKRPLLFQRLEQLALPPNLIKAVRKMYKTVHTRLKLSGSLSKIPLDLMEGIIQGSPLSVSLFGVLMDVIHEELDGGNFDQVDLQGVAVFMILYIDDIVLLTSSIMGMQRLLDAFKVVVDQLGLAVNMSKTEYVVFSRQRGPPKSMHVTYDGIPVPAAKNGLFRYLGVWMHHRKIVDIRDGTQINTARVAAKRLYRYCVNSKLQNVPLQLQLFDVMVRSILCYATPCWAPEVIPADIGNFNKGRSKGFESIHQSYIKQCLSLNGFSPVMSHYFVSGRTPLVIFMMCQMCQYWIKLRFGDPVQKLIVRAQVRMAEAGTSCWGLKFMRLCESYGVKDIAWGSSMSPKEAIALCNDRLLKHFADYAWQSIAEQGRVLSEFQLLLHVRDPPPPPEDGRQEVWFAEPVLAHWLPKKHLAAYMQVKTCSHSLDVNVRGRAPMDSNRSWHPHRVPIAQRICRLCSNDVECASHLVFECSALTEIRAPYSALLAQYRASQPDIRVSLRDLINQQVVVSAKLISKLLEQRNSLLLDLV